MSIEHNLSPAWLESQYRLWQADPRQVSPGWRALFEGFELGAETAADRGYAIKLSAVQSLIYRYRDIGHLLACTNPLDVCPTDHPLLTLSAFGLDESDLDTVFHTRRFLKQGATLREILATLRQTYCRSIGVEFMHIQDPAERQWLIEAMEPVRNRSGFSRAQRLEILRQLLAAARFEAFLHRKFLGQKRFSLEGGESLIPLLHRVVRQGAAAGVRDLILGMAHRGRLNVLVNVFGKPPENLFAEFEDNLEFQVVGEGDVKYHRGFSKDLDIDGRTIHITLASNPSHLEAVDPVVEGKCRARQDQYGAEGVRRVLPVLIHGDAAFAGQGIVAETLNLSALDGYSTGGTLHIVLNNQIGFTTRPEDARSTRYATDVAKMLMVPIFHVHGDDPEAVVRVADLALDWRRSFGRDVVVEILCYRRHGHNEGDEPYFTQPLMYERIQDHPPVDDIYAGRLRQEGVEQETIAGLAAEFEAALETAAEKEPERVDAGFRGKWGEIEREYRHLEVATGVEGRTLVELGRRGTAIPDDFHPHPKIAKLFERQRQAIEAGEEIDWAAAELLAFATLLAEGTPVRLSGQDSRRGTFNQRHSTLFDVETGATWVPLSAVAAGQAPFRVFDSMLSEAAVLGFEYGYAGETPHGLTLWEAQFGDFANGAQVIIDQFVVSSLTKWERGSGLVLLLPHGFEGQGPEHSSARIERFLQLAADDNIQVVYPSTPAQYFHLLRRQVKQPFRRPLIVFSPKSLLRLPACRSPLAELSAGRFREVLADTVEPKQVKTVLLCAGKIWFELAARRDQAERQDVALVRIEQLYPLHRELLRRTLEPLAAAETVAWVQEEPRNMGAWSHLRPHLAELLGREPAYVGRDEAASPAVGSHRVHQEEQQQIIDEAFGL